MWLGYWEWFSYWETLEPHNSPETFNFDIQDLIINPGSLQPLTPGVLEHLKLLNTMTYYNFEAMNLAGNALMPRTPGVKG